MSQSQGTQVLVPGGRIVWVGGDLFKGQLVTEFNSKTPKLDQQGRQMVEYSFGLAIAKKELEPGGSAYPLWEAIFKEAYAMYPSRQLPPAFSLKYKDGDGVDDKGASFATRQGYQGHLVFSLKTQIPIQFFRYENGQNFMVSNGIKCGDYVTVQISVKAHGAMGQGKPGMYLNPQAVQLVREGQEIVNRPTGDQIFGVAAPALPSTINYQAPIAPTGMLVPPGVAQPGFPGVAAPAPMQAAPQPHYGVIPQSLQPAPVPGFPAAQQQIPQPGYAPQAPPHLGYPVAPPQAAPGFPVPTQPGVGATPGFPPPPIR